MKAVSAAFKVHLSQEVTTLCTCWRISRTDGVVLGFTDSTNDIPFDGLLYKAASGYTASAVQAQDGMAVDNLEVEGALDAAALNMADIQAGRWDFAAIEIFQLNYKDLSQGKMMLRRGWLGEVRTGRNAFQVELRGMMQKMQQSFGRIVTPACDADLGDARCGVNLAAYLNAATVTAAYSNRRFLASGLAGAPVAWFNNGLLTFSTGENAGVSMEVKSFSGGEFTLTQPMPSAIVAGDSFSVYAGCDKSLSTCRLKFNNVINFRGFPHVPGLDRVASGT